MAHGGCPDEIDSEDFRNIEILLSDGFIGNKAILLALSCLTTGNLNAKLKQPVTSPYTIKQVLPSMHEYIIPPPSEEGQRVEVQNQLLSFMLSRPESKEFLKE